MSERDMDEKHPGGVRLLSEGDMVKKAVCGKAVAERRGYGQKAAERASL